MSLGINSSFILAGLYRPPSAPSSALAEIATLLSQYTASEMLVLGDFNLNWLSNASDYFKEICGNLTLTQLVMESTRPNLKDPTKSTLLDLILSNKMDSISASAVFDLDISDHCPIGCIRNSSRTKQALRWWLEEILNILMNKLFYLT